MREDCYTWTLNKFDLNARFKIFYNMYEALEELGNGVCVLFDMTKHWTIPIDFKTVLLYVSILRLYSGDNYKQLLSFLSSPEHNAIKVSYFDWSLSVYMV